MNQDDRDKPDLSAGSGSILGRQAARERSRAADDAARASSYSPRNLDVASEREFRLNVLRRLEALERAVADLARNLPK